jgi:hypothetical protein
MNIDKQEIRRYLGYGNKIADNQTETLIDSCLSASEQHIQFLHVHRTFPLRLEKSSVIVEAENFALEGESIRNHLAKSSYCVVMAATLGPKMDQLIRYIGRTDLSEAVVMDAVATTIIEAFCDKIEESIRQQAKKDGLYATHRFSPGYGDFPLTIQSSLLRVLDAQRSIGLTTTENMILIPRKSVTAIIGLQEKPADEKIHTCNDCMPGLSCPFKKEETQIEHS